MPDMLGRYPIEPGVFANGAIQSEVDLSLCIDTLQRSEGESLGLFECHENLTNPDESQGFTLTWHRNIKLKNIYDQCIDSFNVSIAACHYHFGNQLWKYDHVNMCLMAQRCDDMTNFITGFPPGHHTTRRLPDSCSSNEILETDAM